MRRCLLGVLVLAVLLLSVCLSAQRSLLPAYA